MNRMNGISCLLAESVMQPPRLAVARFGIAVLAVAC